jgi:hypothetical protein
LEDEDLLDAELFDDDVLLEDSELGELAELQDELVVIS